MDIVSSSKIVEGIGVPGFGRWSDFIQALYKKLQVIEKKKVGEVQKFIGDGWFLILDEKTDPKFMIDLMVELVDFYNQRYTRDFYGHDNGQDEPIESGLTFGLNFGPVYHLQLAGRSEYISNEINSTARLQSSIKSQKDPNDKPHNQLLMLRQVFRFQNFEGPVESARLRHETVSRSLRHLRQGRSTLCERIYLK